MSERGIWIEDATIVREHDVVRGSVYVYGGRIEKLVLGEERSQRKAPGDAAIDAKGMLLLPGLIDIHCDAIEKEAQPRPNTLFPLDLALFELEKKLAACGITTMYQSVSLGVGLSIRGDDLVVKLLDLISGYAQRRGMIRHRVHLRYELIHHGGLALAIRLVQEGKADYVSLMNHAPGQGQYNKPGSFEAYVMKNQGVDREEARDIAENALRLQERIDWTQVDMLLEEARRRGLPTASHDDDTPERVDEALRRGMTVSEFPITPETAAYAAEKGMHVCVGAPNVVRGGSHDKNMRAADAIRAGHADVLCSDYLPSSLLAAVFKLESEEGLPLPQAVRLASLQPARAMGIDGDFGSIEPGKKADLLLVRRIDGYPHVVKTMVDGVFVYSSEFYFQSDEGGPSV